MDLTLVVFTLICMKLALVQTEKCAYVPASADRLSAVSFMLPHQQECVCSSVHKGHVLNGGCPQEDSGDFLSIILCLFCISSCGNIFIYAKVNTSFSLECDVI